MAEFVTEITFRWWPGWERNVVGTLPHSCAEVGEGHGRPGILPDHEVTGTVEPERQPSGQGALERAHHDVVGVPDDC
jgi:hypothetical protein